VAAETQLDADLAPTPGGDGAEQQPPRGPRNRALLPLGSLLVIMIVAAVTIALNSGGSKPTAAATSKSDALHGLTFVPPQPAPPIQLRNYLGQPVNLSEYRGKAMLVTFLYVHCPDVCPLITSKLHTVLTLLGRRASEVQVLAVSVDPHGDKPAAVAIFLHAHQMTGRMQYLIGNAAALVPVWEAWHVGSQQDTSNPELVNHTALVYGVSASQRLTTLYSSDFNPSDVAADVPALLHR
jgi:protein SCO1/2